MLKIWMNENNFVGNKVASPDSWYDAYRRDDVLGSDLAKAIIKDTSAVLKLEGLNTFVTKFGYVISDNKLSEGCKMLLMMLNKDCRDDELGFCLNFMGENCDKYIEEIAGIYDINLILTRHFIPRSDKTYKNGVYIKELDSIVHSKEDYISAYLKYF